MKQLFVLLLFIVFSNCSVRAQKYIVYTVNNGVEHIMKDKTRRLKVKDVLTPQDVIVMPYNSTLELFDKTNKKRIVIKTPGKGNIIDFTKNNKTEITSLSERLFKFMMSWMTGETVNRGEGYSDGGDVTREEFVDSTVFIIRDSMEMMEVK